MAHQIALRVSAEFPLRVFLAAALLALGFVLAGALAGWNSSVPPAVRASHKGLSSLSLAAQGQISTVLGADEPTYRIGPSAGIFQSDNPAQRLHARFERSGVLVSTRAMRVGLSLRGVGYGTSLSAVGEGTQSARANRVTYAHAGLSEWYANGPLGLEQGFTIPKELSAHHAGPLTLSITLSGNAHASLEHGGQGILLGRAGGPSLRYTGLSASDARGHQMHAWLQLSHGKLLLRVDARGALYPLRIDPLLQEAKLTGAGEVCETVDGCRFGLTVALSADGNTALVGGPHDVRGTGAAWVFTRHGTSWTQQGPKLTGTENSYARFGGSVALSADGNTALIGGPGGGPGAKGGWGAAWVFTRKGTTWSQQGPKLLGSEIDSAVFLGYSVALSADGNTALMGAPGGGTDPGAAFVFTREGTTWTQQGRELTGSEELGKGHVGRSVALSADGNTALVGGNTDDGGVGAAWVFTRAGTSWTQQGAKLTGKEELGGGGFGYSVALSSDGNTALIGGHKDDKDLGAAWVFARSGTSWSQQTKLTGKEESVRGGLGESVALSADGNTALIGAGAAEKRLGAAWMFTREGTTWTQQGPKVTGDQELGEGRFGRSVALSADGNTALIGGDKDEHSVGAAWVFVRTKNSNETSASGSRHAATVSPHVTGTAPSSDGRTGTPPTGSPLVPTCATNTGTVTLSPGLTAQAAAQTMTVNGILTGCTGGSFTEVRYRARLATSGPVSCAVLTSAGEIARGAATYTWTPKAKASHGTMSMLLTDTLGGPFSGEVEGGSYSPLTVSGPVSQSYAGLATCGRKAVKKGTFTGSAVGFQ